MSNIPPLPQNEGILEMYHFQESIQSIEHGLAIMMHGLRDFQAGVENLRVLFQKIEELTMSSLETEGFGSEGEESDTDSEAGESDELRRRKVDKGKGRAISDEEGDAEEVVISC